MKSGFLRFVNQMKNRFLKKKLNSNPSNSQKEEIKSSGSNTWTLNPKQRVRVQEDAARVAAECRKQGSTTKNNQVQQK